MDTTADSGHHVNQVAAETQRPPRRRLVAVVAAVVAAALLLLITPFPRGFRGEATGDAALRGEVEKALGSKHWHHMAAAKIDGDEVTAAGVGADENTEFEIGSITKTFTAALYADAIERGEIDKDTRLGDVWPELDGDVAQVSLASIAAQRSGLPTLPPAPDFITGARSAVANYIHTDPYSGTRTQLIDSLSTVDVGDEKPEYSNYAFAVLGQTLAEAAGESYADLVRKRITDPLGMDDTFVPSSSDGLTHGYTASGLPAAPWTMHGCAPAGAIRSTTHDLSIWLQATVNGKAPGAEAAHPRTKFDENNRIGWAWLTTTSRSPNVTWHNGGTGGYRSFLGFNADERTGIIVLVDTANSVDAAMGLISSDSTSAADALASKKG